MTGVVPADAQEGGDCTVCMEPLVTDVVQLLTCKHHFHCVCVLAWLQGEGRQNRTCPNCRCVLYEGTPLLFGNNTTHRPNNTLSSVGDGLFRNSIRQAAVRDAELAREVAQYRLDHADTMLEIAREHVTETAAQEAMHSDPNYYRVMWGSTRYDAVRTHERNEVEQAERDVEAAHTAFREATNRLVLLQDVYAPPVNSSRPLVSPVPYVDTRDYPTVSPFAVNSPDAANSGTQVANTVPDWQAESHGRLFPPHVSPFAANSPSAANSGAQITNADLNRQASSIQEQFRSQCGYARRRELEDRDLHEQD